MCVLVSGNSVKTVVEFLVKFQQNSWYWMLWLLTVHENKFLALAIQPVAALDFCEYLVVVVEVVVLIVVVVVVVLLNEFDTLFN